MAEKDLALALRDISEMEHTGDKNRKQTTLGLIWNTETDEMFLRKPDFNLNANQRLTKRQVVSLSHQVFDPLSWWAPFYVQMNLCCSKVVRQTPDWDEEISSELNKEWDKAVRQWEGMELASLPRRRISLNVEDNSFYEYHMFADSSKDVAAAAVCLRVKIGECYTVHLVAAKTSVISATEMARGSMSRKEIIALNIGARLLRECLDATTLPINNFELGSDSRTVIQWCTEKSLALQVCERNRVDLILRNSDGTLPRYIPTDINPADVVTRPFNANHQVRWQLWLQGPDFLKLPDSSWEEHKFSGTAQNVSPRESRVAFVSSTSANDSRFLQYHLDRTNELSKAIRVTCAVAKCFQKWKKVLKRLAQEDTCSQPPDEQQVARMILIRATQN